MEPKLYKRGASGNYFFRRLINGKDKAVNTGTTNLAEAKVFRKTYMDAEIIAVDERKHEAGMFLYLALMN